MNNASKAAFSLESSNSRRPLPTPFVAKQHRASPMFSPWVDVAVLLEVKPHNSCALNRRNGDAGLWEGRSAASLHI